MSKVKINIWNREFDLPVSFSCYPGEEILLEQKKALAAFCDEEFPTEGSLKDITKYVEKTAANKLNGMEIDNIFKFVMPKSLYIPRTKENVVAIICNYKFDMENGIAVVFKDNKLNKIGTQDIIL